MSDEATSGRGVEKSVYLVGGLGLGLFGIQQLATTVVNMYGVTYNSAGRTVDISPPTWAGWTAGLVVGVLFLLGGAYLLIRAARLGSTRPTNVAKPMGTPQ